MIKYVKDIDSNGKCSQVSVGTNEKFYLSIGMTKQDVEQSEKDGQWYLKNKCPHYTDEEKKAIADKAEQDKLQAEYEAQRLDNVESAITDLAMSSVNSDTNSEAIADLATYIANLQATVDELKGEIKTLKGE